MLHDATVRSIQGVSDCVTYPAYLAPAYRLIRRRQASKVQMMSWLTNLRNRHPDGSSHDCLYHADDPGLHNCEDYCHHYVAKCHTCGKLEVHGYSIPEVR